MLWRTSTAESGQVTQSSVNDTPVKQNTQKQQVSNNSFTPHRLNQNIICYNCSQAGHISRNCAAPRRQKEPVVKNVYGLTSGKKNANVGLHAKITIGRHTSDVLLDSGCELSMVPWHMIKHISLN